MMMMVGTYVGGYHHSHCRGHAKNKAAWGDGGCCVVWGRVRPFGPLAPHLGLPPVEVVGGGQRGALASLAAVRSVAQEEVALVAQPLHLAHHRHTVPAGHLLGPRPPSRHLHGNQLLLLLLFPLLLLDVFFGRGSPLLPSPTTAAAAAALEHSSAVLVVKASPRPQLLPAETRLPRSSSSSSSRWEVEYRHEQQDGGDDAAPRYTSRGIKPVHFSATVVCLGGNCCLVLLPQQAHKSFKVCANCAPRMDDFLCSFPFRPQRNSP
jgi:hypothetical protein